MFLVIAAQHSRYIFHVFLVFPFMLAYLILKIKRRLSGAAPLPAQAA
jgi:hypothetical protein